MASIVSGINIVVFTGSSTAITSTAISGSNTTRVYKPEFPASGVASWRSYKPGGSLNPFSTLEPSTAYWIVATGPYTLANAYGTGEASGAVPKCGALKRGANLCVYRGASSYNLDGASSRFTSASTVRIYRLNAGSVQSWAPGGGGANQFTTLTAGNTGTAYLVVTRRAFLCPTLTPIDASMSVAHGTGQTDTLTDMTLACNVESIASGNWSSGSTWAGGVVPAAGDCVCVNVGHTVAYDVNDPSTELYAVGVEGTLNFAVDRNTAMLVRHVHVHDDGLMTMGTEADPVPQTYTCRLIFADSPIETDVEPEQWCNGLTVMGRLETYGAVKTPFVRATGALSSSATTVSLASTPTNWKSGDHVVIPDSRQPVAGSTGHVYTPYLGTLSADVSGASCSLSSGLAHAHPGTQDASGSAVSGYYPHVANLTRNVRIESETDSGDGVGGDAGGIGTAPTAVNGHVAILHHGSAHCRYTEFRGLGRTRFTDGTAPDNSTYDGSGNVSHVGQNQIGKYAFHLHHAYGDPDGDPSGYQNRLIGCSFSRLFSGSTPRAERWPVAIHDTAFNLIQNNVIYNGSGALVALEQGHETENLIDGNFCCHVGGNGGNDGSGNSGDCVWTTALSNYFDNNVLTNAAAGGGDYNWGFRFDLRNHLNTDVRVYTTPGSPSAYEVAQATGNPILSFSGNEIYACNGAWTNWHTGNNTKRSGRAGTFSGLKAWNCIQQYAYLYPCHGLTLDGCTYYGTWTDRTTTEMTAEIFRNVDYEVSRLTIDGCTFSGVKFGIMVPPNSLATDWSVPALECIDTNVGSATTAYRAEPAFKVTFSGGRLSGTRRARLSNCTATAVNAGSISFYDVYTVSSSNTQGGTGIDVVAGLVVRAYDIQGSAGDHQALYNVTQGGSVVTPQTDESPVPYFTGSPDAGKTNSQNFTDNNELCIYGEILPGGATTKTGMGTDVRVSSISAYSAPSADAVLAIFGQKLSFNLRADAAVYKPEALGYSAFGKNTPADNGACGYWQGQDWRDTPMQFTSAATGATITTTAGVPYAKYVSSGLNSKPVIEFDGNDFPLSAEDQNTNDPTVRKNWTFLALCRPDQAGGLYQLSRRSHSGLGFFDASSPMKFAYRGDGGDPTYELSGATSKNYGSWVMVLLRKSEDTLQVWEYTGGSLNSLGTKTASWITDTDQFGKFLTVNSVNFKGRLAHVCFLSRALSNSDCETLADTVASEWSYTG